MKTARLLWLIVLIALCALLGVETLRRTAAHRYAESDPALALRWEPADPDAGDTWANRLTAKALAAGQPAKAAEMRSAAGEAARVARAAPMHVDALRDLALIEQARGDSASAYRLMTEAGRRGFRDVATQAWLLQQSLARQDLAAALPRFDAILRVNPDMEPRLFPALFALLQVPDGPELLARRLASRPPWRDNLLLYLARDSQSADPALDLFQRLVRLDSPPDDLAESALLYRLAGDGRFGEARALWRSRLGPRSPSGSFPYDGDFRGLPGPAPFNWRLEQPIGERLRRETADDGRPVLAFDVPANVAEPLAEQLVMLAPGAWTLSADLRVRSPIPGAGVTLTLACAGSPTPVMVLRQDASAERAWTRASTTAAIPPNCPAQWLRVATTAADSFGQLSADIARVQLAPATLAAR